uniref:L-galactose dehydrogenase family protein n=1 Tax=Rhizophora mucronata TaxID=61149 RepID=A0A2P2JIP2_RHIMU
MSRRKASRTEETASCSETGPKTLPRGEAPKPTQLSFRPVFPRSRSSKLGRGVVAAIFAAALRFSSEEK